MSYFYPRFADADGKEVDATPLLNYLRRLVNDFPLYPEKYYLKNISEIKNEATKSSWIVSPKPTLEAWVNPKENQICISFFLLFALNAIPNISSYIDSLAAKTCASTVEDIFDDFNKNNKLFFEDIHSFFNACRQILNCSAHEQNWSLASFLRFDAEREYRQAIRFTILHEISHWNIARFNETAKKNIFDRTRKYLNEYLQNISDKRTVSIAQGYLKSQNTERSWIEEITCDAMAFTTIRGFCNNPEDIREANICLSLIFGMIKLQQLYQRYTGQKLSYSTHPPVEMREFTLLHILAGEQGISTQQYFSEQHGAAMAVSLLFDHLCGLAEATYR